MSISESEFAPMQMPRLAALATSASPAWLWSVDGSRILWANAVGAAIFGAPNSAESGKLRFNGKDSTTAQIVRLAATLPNGSERLERLRGFGAGLRGTLTCICSRLGLPDGTTAVLVAAAEPAGPAIGLDERLRRLIDGAPTAFAAFSADGKLLHANAAARERLNGTARLSTLGIEPLAAKALDAGRASGTAQLGQSPVEVNAARLDSGDARFVMFSWQPSGSATTKPTPDQTDPDSASSASAAATNGAQAQGSPPPSMATSAGASGAEPPAAVSPALHDSAATERRHPLRFVWQMDADGRFVIGSDEFVEVVGSRTTAACGRLWSEIAAELKLDSDNQVVHAIATRETWSGIVVSWPVDDSAERLPVELSGLPIVDRDRTYRGYRGFGVCRDIDRINRLMQTRQQRPIGFATPLGAAATQDVAPPQEEAPAPESIVAADLPPAPAAAEKPAAHSDTATREEQAASDVAAPVAANVVPFRSAPSGDPKEPSLSPVERNAFRELAQELAARLRGAPDEPAAEPAPQQPAPAGEHNATETIEVAEVAVGEPSNELAAVSSAVATIAADMPPVEHSPAADAEPPHVMPASELLDRVPAAVLVHRNDALIYANRHFFELSGYDSLDELAAAGGLNSLFAEPVADALADDGATQRLSIVTRHGDKVPVEGRLFTIPWNGTSALALVLASGQAEERLRASQAALSAAENEVRDLKSMLERTARREAQKATAAKADFLSKVSHELRTPLNSIIGFAEVIMAERFGPIGNERYREYLKDMHGAGTHVVSLLNDLLDLSKIETGQLDLNFVEVDLNELTKQCVAIMQPQANRARIIIRSALTQGVPKVLADERSVRQIALNLLAHAIKFTGPGGQVIVSTAVADGGESILRVRDTGVGMREKDIEAVLEPFQQNATSPSWGSGGTGFGLPLTKALAEANRASFSIKSAPNAGTLVEITFPQNRALPQ